MTTASSGYHPPDKSIVHPNPIFSDNMVLQRGMRVPVWGTADPGAVVTVAFQDQTVSTVAEGGRWAVRLEALKEGGPDALTIRSGNSMLIKNVLVGEVWLCSGQSNMAMPLAECANADPEIADADNQNMRLLTIPQVAADARMTTFQGSWQECRPESAARFSGVAYFFGKELQQVLGVPVGLINASAGNSPVEAWICRQTLAGSASLRSVVTEYERAVEVFRQAKAEYERAVAAHRRAQEQAKREGAEPPPRLRMSEPMGPSHPFRPGALYNGMIAPLQPFAFRGAIWYQGESNASSTAKAALYEKLFPAMISCWREAWGQGDFPFLFVQLTGFGSLPIRDYPRLRESQARTLSLHNTAMAVSIDVGEEANMHPRQKKPIGHRLALLARGRVYGERVPYASPTFDSMKIEGGRAFVKFNDTYGGLVARGENVLGFEIAGKDGRFAPADARIQGDVAVVSSPEVPEPARVRYGWANFPVCNVYNLAGLPAAPFRTNGD